MGSETLVDVAYISGLVEAQFHLSGRLCMCSDWQLLGAMTCRRQRTWGGGGAEGFEPPTF